MVVLDLEDQGQRCGSFAGRHGFGNKVVAVWEVKPGDAGLEEERR